MSGVIATNFAYGTGPYLRTTELAIAFNRALEARGRPRMKILVPWVYGDRQRAVMREEFGAHEDLYPGEILLDADAGAILRDIFYGDEPYVFALRRWIETYGATSDALKRHFAGSISVVTLFGVRAEVKGVEIVLELNRSSRVKTGIVPSYATTFGYTSTILERAVTDARDAVAVDKALLQKGAALARSIEEAERLHAVAYPATFSGRRDYQPLFPTEFLTPPLTSQFPSATASSLEPGMYVTVTGIPGLERLYREAKELGLKLYASDAMMVPGSAHAHPRVLAHPNMVLQFARSGWGSVWLSMHCGVPIVVPAYDSEDDPEIYFNNIMVEELGIGMVWRGEKLGDILLRAPEMRERGAALKKEILKRWGTGDGHAVAAERFADDFLER